MLSTRQISKSYDNKLILDNINFRLSNGKILGILGESGAGKSTLLQILGGLLDPDEGEVWLNNKRVPMASEQLIAGHPDIKIVFQDYRLSSPLTVRENIAYALRFYEKVYQQERIDELLSLCQLQNIDHQLVRTLSGGEKQRTAIAQALAEKAKVLLLDEPFAHLDYPNKIRLQQTLHNLVHQQQLSCVFVTHNITEAIGISDTLAVIQDGKIAQIDTPENIYQKPANVYIAEMTGLINWLTPSFAKKHQINDTPIFENQKIGLRPEQLFVSTNNSRAIEVIIKKCNYEGSRYLIQAISQRQNLYFYHPTKIKPGEVVHLGYQSKVVD